MYGMARRVYILFILVILAAMAVLEYYASLNFWYWRFWWFDMIMHTLGGLSVTLAALWVIFLRKNEHPKEARTSSVALVAFAAISIVGIGWEVFEIIAHRFFNLRTGGGWNAVSDLSFDLVGSSIAVIIFLMIYNKVKSFFS